VISDAAEYENAVSSSGSTDDHHSDEDVKQEMIMVIMKLGW